MGLEWSGIIVDAQGALVGLGDLSQPPVMLALFGLTVIAVLMVRGVNAAFLIGIAISAVVGVLLNIIEYKGLFSAPPSLAPTAFALDLSLLGRSEFWVVVAVFLFLDIFDTLSTLVGIAPEAGMVKQGGRH